MKHKNSILITLILTTFFPIYQLYYQLYAEEYVGLSLSNLQESLKSCNIDGHTELPMGTVIGIIIDESDMILLGQEGGFQGITVDDIILAMRGAFTAYQALGLTTISGLSPDTSITSLIYAGGVENTSVGSYMADCIRRLHLLGTGKAKVLLEGFWPYGKLPKVKLWFYPQPSQYLVSSNKRLMLFKGNGVVLRPKEMKWKEVDPRVREWVEQIGERYDEMGKIYPELIQLRNFFNLYKVFLWAKENMRSAENWQYLLEDYHPTSTYTPSFFRFNAEQSIAGGIFCQIGEITLLNKPRLDDLEEKIMDAQKSAPGALFWYFQLPLADLIEEDKDLRKTIVELKEVGLYGQSVFLYLKIKEKTPSLRILHDDLFYRRPTQIARSLKWLIKQAIQGEGDFQTGWRKFCQNELLPLVTKRSLTVGDRQLILKPVLVLISDDVSSKWILLEKIKVLKENFIIFLVPHKGKVGLWTSTEVFLNKVKVLPEIKRGNLAVVIQISHVQLKKCQKQIEELKKVMGNGKVLVNPTKKQFELLLSDREIEVALMQLTSTNEEIMFDDEALSYKDILKFKKLSHLKYIMLIPQGTGWGETLLKALQTKGVGLISILPKKPLCKEEFVSLVSFLQTDETEDLRVFHLPTLLGSDGGYVGWESIP